LLFQKNIGKLDDDGQFFTLFRYPVKGNGVRVIIVFKSDHILAALHPQNTGHGFSQGVFVDFHGDGVHGYGILVFKLYFRFWRLFFFYRIQNLFFRLKGEVFGLGIGFKEPVWYGRRTPLQKVEDRRYSLDFIGDRNAFNIRVGKISPMFGEIIRCKHMGAVLEISEETGEAQPASVSFAEQGILEFNLQTGISTYSWFPDIVLCFRKVFIQEHGGGVCTFQGQGVGEGADQCLFIDPGWQGCHHYRVFILVF